MIKIMTVALAVLLFLTVSMVHAVDLDGSQERVLKVAHECGESVAESLGPIAQGIAWQETFAGAIKHRKNPHADDPNIEKRYFGVMQVKLAALRDVERISGIDYGGTKEERAARLRDDDDFNLFVAVRYLKYLLDYFDGDAERSILAYNVGMGKVRKYGLRHDPNNYLSGVKTHIGDWIIDFNRDNGLRSHWNKAP